MLGTTHGADLRDGIDTGWDIFSQQMCRLAMNDGLRDKPTLVISGAGKAWVTNDITHRINVFHLSLVIGVDD
ncbi:Uncharacterised protein [Vibrio cholerae]|nr:Uncharacterised protein [Vibrio cholerae]CSC85013.1 Uncharacterised protein [Vibrio cholerae]CSC93084.1 Uncharacterised protein [Vibrio cholerae]